MNEYELVYLFQEGYNNKALFSIYKMYSKVLEIVKRKTFYKYFSLPIDLPDLESLKYFSVLESCKMYNPQSGKKLKDYIAQRYVWDIHKQVRQLLSVKNRVLNYYTKISDENMNALGYDDCFALKIGIYEEQKTLIKQFYKRLSPLEKEVFRLWYAGKDISSIQYHLELDYRQVDNAMQRIMQKSKDFCKNN